MNKHIERRKWKESNKLFRELYRIAQRTGNIIMTEHYTIVVGYNPKIMRLLSAGNVSTVFKDNRSIKRKPRYYIVFGNGIPRDKKYIDVILWHEYGHIKNGDLKDPRYNVELNYHRLHNKPSINNIATLSEINADLVSVEYCGLNHVIRWLDHTFECVYRDIRQSDTYNDLDRIGVNELYIRILVLLKRCKKVNRRFKLWKRTTMLKNNGSTI